MEIVRAVFDTAREFLNPHRSSCRLPAHAEQKAGQVTQSRREIPYRWPLHASDHTNFKQAVISMDACVVALEERALWVKRRPAWQLAERRPRRSGRSDGVTADGTTAPESRIAGTAVAQSKEQRCQWMR